MFVNGLGHELIADPYFDDGTNWWSTTGESTITNGVARIYSSAGVVTSILRNNILTANTEYCLEYNVSSYTTGILTIYLASGNEFTIPSSVGTHKIYFTSVEPNLVIKRGSFPSDSNRADISLIYASVKQVFS